MATIDKINLGETSYDIRDTSTKQISQGGTNATTASKALYNLISDMTASLTSSTVNGSDLIAVDDVSASTAKKMTMANLLDYISTNMTGGAKIVTGSYVGTGTYGASNPCSLTFDFEPKLIFGPTYNRQGQELWGANFNDYGAEYFGLIPAFLLTTEYQPYFGFGYASGGVTNPYAKKSTDGKTISWYSTSGSSQQVNLEGRTYCCFAIG